MKASLPPLKKTRLPWFDELAQVEIEREVTIQYSINSVVQDSLFHNAQRRYVFRFPQEREIPTSDVILMMQGMPFLITKTSGSVGEKLQTVKLTDSTIVIEDRIAKRERGKETVTVEDLPYPDKIQETRVREDIISRRITLKNEVGKDIDLTVKIVESGDVQLIKVIPEAIKAEKPTFEWKIALKKDTEESIQCEYRIRIEKIREIEKPKPPMDKD
ncbi:MAG: hypothetical protein ACFFCD_07855 [Promethearchaeota archaeon]